MQHYTCTVKARSVGVWRQISDMASLVLGLGFVLVLVLVLSSGTYKLRHV